MDTHYGHMYSRCHSTVQITAYNRSTIAQIAIVLLIVLLSETFRQVESNAYINSQSHLNISNMCLLAAGWNLRDRCSFYFGIRIIFDFFSLLDNMRQRLNLL